MAAAGGDGELRMPETTLPPKSFRWWNDCGGEGRGDTEGSPGIPTSVQTPSPSLLLMDRQWRGAVCP